MKLAQIGEDGLLARLLPRLPANRSVVSAAGDDCAVLAAPDRANLLLLKTDCVVEGVHFTSETDAALVGWKAIARPLSDFAAMAGVPQFALVTLLAQPNREVAWVTKLYRGLEKAASRFHVSIVGGETSSTSGPTAISVSMTGYVEKNRWIARNGGKAGDELFVTGRLGGSLRRKHLRFVPRIEEARWLAQHFHVHAMMDLSDGLGADLPRLARASGVGFELDENAIPRNRGVTTEEAIADGEDYELLFAIDPAESDRLQTMWRKKFAGLPLTRIGCLTRKSSTAARKLPRGYVHFAQR